MACTAVPRYNPDEVSPSTNAVDQASHEGQIDVQIANVKLVISELASKAGRDILLQVADVFTPVHQMRRPDAD